MEIPRPHQSIIIKSIGLVGFLALIRALFGFGKDVAIAHYFGATWVADVLLATLAIPTMIFWTLGNSLESVFIPEFLKKSFARPGEAKLKSISFFFSVLVITTLLAILLIVLTPYYIHLIFPGFNPEALVLATNLLRGFLILIILQTLFLTLKGFYHAQKKFLKPALVAIIASLTVILSVIFLQKQWGPYSVMGGFILGSLIQIFILAKNVFDQKFNLRQIISDLPWLKKIWRLAWPLILAALFVQFNLVVDKMIASRLETGSISALTYSARIFQLPVDLFGVALYTVMLPVLTSSLVNKNFAQYKLDFRLGLNLVLLLILPLSFFLIFFAQPIVQILFQRGAFEAQATLKTAAALSFYALGLVFITLTYLSERALQSLQKVKILLYINLTAFVINIILDFTLSKIWGFRGIALATSFVYTISVLWQLAVLAKNMPGLFSRKNYFILGKIFLALMVVIDALILINGGLFMAETFNLHHALRFISQVGLAVFLYYFVLRLLKIDLIKLIRKKDENTLS